MKASLAGPETSPARNHKERLLRNTVSNRSEMPDLPTDEELSALTEKAKLAVAEFQRKVLVEKRMTTKDFVAHLAAVSEVFADSARMVVRFGEVVRYQADQISSLISGRGTGTK